MKKSSLFFRLLIPLSLISSVVFGQTAEPVSSSKVSIGISFSPDYSYRTLHSAGSFQIGTEFRDTVEIAKLGYTAGLSLLVKLWNRVSFETGLYFSNKRYRTKSIALYDINPPFEEPVNRIKSSYNYYYLNIPIKVNYFILTGKIKLFASAGFSTNIFLDEREKVTFEDPESAETIKNSAKFQT